MVREFSIGMGPKLFYHRSGSTTFTVRLLPLGGYVLMAGNEDDGSDELKPGTPVSLKLNEKGVVTSINTSKKQGLFQGVPLTVSASNLDDELWLKGYENGDDSKEVKYPVDHDATIIESDGTEMQIAPRDVQFKSASLPKRMLTNFAGVFNNFILAIIVYTLLSFVQGGVFSNSNKVDIAPNVSIARDAGIKSGDRIVSINGKKTDNWDQLALEIQSNPDKKVPVKFTSGNKTTTKEVKIGSQTANNKKIGLLGITRSLETSFSAKIVSGFTQTWSVGKQLLSTLWSMVSGHFSLNDLGGPVAIFATTSQAASYGLAGILNFLAFLSLNLAIINLIPIPGLDGGKLILNIIEAIRRKPVSERTETVVTLIGFAFLMLLMLLVTWNDIQRYFIH